MAREEGVFAGAEALQHGGGIVASHEHRRALGVQARDPLPPVVEIQPGRGRRSLLALRALLVHLHPPSPGARCCWIDSTVR